MENIGYMVCVKCYTFNHANYIEDTMDGFCLQQTGFPFVCTIIDDASMDGEPEVIIKYLHKHFDLEDKSIVRNEETNDYILIFTRHKINPNCYFAVLFLKYNHYSIKKNKESYISEWQNNAKYIALCEGDDYWIDYKKLQKQVDFMEANLDFGMVHTNYKLVNGHRNPLYSPPDVIAFPDLITYNGQRIAIGTLTAMFRNSIYKIIPRHYIGKGWLMGDYPLWIEISHESKIKYLKDKTAKYRVLKESASHSTDIKRHLAFTNSGFAIRKFYAEIYGLTTVDIYDSYYYEDIVRFSARLGSYETANKYYEIAKQKNKLNLRIRLFYLSAKYPILKKCLDCLYKI